MNATGRPAAACPEREGARRPLLARTHWAQRVEAAQLVRQAHRAGLYGRRRRRGLLRLLRLLRGRVLVVVVMAGLLLMLPVLLVRGVVAVMSAVVCGLLLVLVDVHLRRGRHAVDGTLLPVGGRRTRI